MPLIRLYPLSHLHLGRCALLWHRRRHVRVSSTYYTQWLLLKTLDHRTRALRYARIYSFAKVGLVFFMEERSADLTSSVWRLAEFQMAVYRRPRRVR
jgi:hypothetical protein